MFYIREFCEGYVVIDFRVVERGLMAGFIVLFFGEGVLGVDFLDRGLEWGLVFLGELVFLFLVWCKCFSRWCF